MDNRLDHLRRFYSILSVQDACGKTPRRLKDCTRQLEWPARGLYFFHEDGEYRSDSGGGLRVVRVGTHALKEKATSTLWKRLSQHRGQLKTGGGNHRGSIFRLLVGNALLNKRGIGHSTWGRGSNAARDIRNEEYAMECDVSEVIRSMPFRFIAIDDEPGPSSLRGFLERNTIALLSNFNRPPLDKASSEWLGHHCDRDRVRQSGLWNCRHVDEQYDPDFLNIFERFAAAGGRQS